MTTYGQWITKSEHIGASIAGIAGFLFGAYIIATSHALSSTDVLDTLGSAVAVLLFAGAIGSLCTVVGWLAGLVLGILASPLGSFAEKRPELDAREPKAQQKKAA